MHKRISSNIEINQGIFFGMQLVQPNQIVYNHVKITHKTISYDFDWCFKYQISSFEACMGELFFIQLIKL